MSARQGSSLFSAILGTPQWFNINFVFSQALAKSKAIDNCVERKQISKVSPDIELTQRVDIGGEPVKVDIPMTVGFFWPSTEG